LQLAHLISSQASVMLKQQSKLLIVEDEVLFARAVMRRLQKAGYECAHVESLQDARTIFKQFSPDIVLLDMRLPDGNGLDLLSDLVAKNVAVIVMTAHGEISDAVNAIKQGAIDYLKKPIDLEELLFKRLKLQRIKIIDWTIHVNATHMRLMVLSCWVIAMLCKA
jgi:two-component system response regulator AtoC